MFERIIRLEKETVEDAYARMGSRLKRAGELSMNAEKSGDILGKTRAFTEMWNARGATRRTYLVLTDRVRIPIGEEPKNFHPLRCS